MGKSSFTNAILNLLIVAILIGGAVFIGDALSRNSLSSEDSSALFGGRPESGYPPAGFMLSFNGNNLVDLCGLVVISQTQAVSAAHCFDKGNEFYLGLGEFTADKNRLIRITGFQQRPGWDRRTSNNDFAIATLAQPVNLSSSDFAEISTPKSGCNYVVVAYGRNETEVNAGGLTLNRPRKSADICITSLQVDIIYINSPSGGEQGGICNGDSGSAIFEKGNNRLVGVVSAIIKPQNNTAACFVGNTAIVNRADNNLSFINGLPVTANASGNVSQPIPGQDLTTTPTGVDLFNQIANGSFDPAKLPRNQQYTLIAIIVALIILLGYILLKSIFTPTASVTVPINNLTPNKTSGLSTSPSPAMQVPVQPPVVTTPQFQSTSVIPTNNPPVAAVVNQAQVQHVVSSTMQLTGNKTSTPVNTSTPLPPLPPLPQN